MKASAAALPLLVLGGGVWAWAHYGHSTIRHATEAEVRSVVPADLLPTTVADPAAMQRFGQLANVCKGIDFNWDIDTSAATQRQNIKDLGANGGCVDVAKLIMRKGPIKAPPGGSMLKNWQYLTTLAHALAFQSRIAGAAGDHRLCFQSINDGLALAKAVCSAGGGANGYYEFATVDTIAVHNAADCVREGDLTPAQQRYLMAEVAGFGRSNTQEKEDLKQELSNRLYEPSYGVVSLASEFSVPANNPDEEDETGNFDTVQTAKLLTRLFAIWVDNGGRDWRSRDQSATKLMASLDAELPKDPWRTTANTDVEGRRVPSSSEKVAFQAAMNAIPNSAGIRLISEEVDWGQRMEEDSARISCNHALLIVSIGIAEYRADHQGQLPSTLDELVTGEYLERVPTDAFSGRPLRYDPRSGSVYSVGADGTDDNGKFGRELDRSEPDYGLFSTAKPLAALKQAATKDRH